MDRTRTVHQCLFCPSTFDSAVAKDDHTLEHFAQEMCSGCDRNLIRIGGKMYMLHDKDTCIKSETHHHVERDKCDVQDEGDMFLKNIDHISDVAPAHDSSDVEDLDIKIEFESSDVQDECETTVKTERPSIAIDDSNLQTLGGDIFLTNDVLDSNESEDELHTSSTNTVGIERKRCACDICGKACFADALLRHKIRMHRFCVLCKKSFPNKAEFKVHKPKCKETLKQAENTQCNICNAKMKTRKTYLAHMKTIHNPLGKPQKCDSCGRSFRDMASLRVHVCRRDEDKQPSVFIDPKIHLIDGRYVCDVCNASLKSRTALKMHKIFIHKELGDIVCRLCAKPFPSSDEFLKHQIECQLKKQNSKWSDFKSFECDICKAILKSRAGIRQHILHTHMKIAKRFACELCKLKFCGRFDLKLHHKTVHLNIRDIICNVCGKAFKLKYQLTNHMFVHSNEKFKCTQHGCDKYFSSPMSRKAHMATHCEVAQEDRLKCDLCTLTFANKITLQKHQSVHLAVREWKCLICDVAFKSKKALQLHTYRHTGEKPWQCTFDGCERKFRSQSNRDEHMRSHTGEKPFICTFDGCNKRFRFAIDFRRHKLNTHGVASNQNFPCSICSEILPKYSLLRKHMQNHGVPPSSQ